VVRVFGALGERVSEIRGLARTYGDTSGGGAIALLGSAGLVEIAVPGGHAGLLLGLQRGLDWPTTGRIASLAGAIKIEHHGTQQHQYDWPAFAARFHNAGGSVLKGVVDAARYTSRRQVNRRELRGVRRRH
jgi:hypothetical protein